MPHAELAIPFLTAFSVSLASAPTSQFVLHLVCSEMRDAALTGGLLASSAEVSEYCKRPDVQVIVKGRRPFIILPLVGIMIQMITIILVGIFHLPSWVLALGYLCEGVAGGFNALLTASDKVDPNRRTYFFMLIEVAIFLGLAIGPVTMAGVVSLPLSKQYPQLIFFLGILAMLLTIISVFIFIKTDKSIHRSPSLLIEETVIVDELVTQTELPPPTTILQLILEKGNIFTGLPILWRPWNRTRFLLLINTVIIGMCFCGTMIIFIPYTYRRFNWTSKDDGYYFFTRCIGQLAVLGLSAKMISRLQHHPVEVKHSEELAEHLSQSYNAEDSQYGLLNNNRPIKPISGEEGQSTCLIDSTDPLLYNEHTSHVPIPIVEPSSEKSMLVTITKTNDTSSLMMEEEEVPLLMPDEVQLPVVHQSTTTTTTTTCIWTDGFLVRIGLLTAALFYLGFGLAWKGWMLFAVGIIDSFSVLCYPSMRSILSQTVSTSLQGTLLSSVSAVSGMGSMIAPLLFNLVYTHTVGHMDGAVYLVTAVGVFVGFILSFGIRRQDVRLYPIDTSENIEGSETNAEAR